MTLNRALVNAATAPDIAERLAEDGGSAIGSSPAEFARHMVDETARWQKLARLTGLKLDRGTRPRRVLQCWRPVAARINLR